MRCCVCDDCEMCLDVRISLVTFLNLCSISLINLLSSWNFFHYSTRWSSSLLKPFLRLMDPALLTAATSKKCHHRQLLLLLLLLSSSSLSALSLAAKTQIYSQEVAFNCHFFPCYGVFHAGSEELQHRCRRMQRSLLFCSCFGYDEILQFLLPLPPPAATLLPLFPCT